jgi:ribulose-phosphate 3-epimerase
MQIIPAILATSEAEYSQRVQTVNSTPEFNGGWVQIDFADNKFVQNQTVDMVLVKKYPISLKKEAHLMVADPLTWIDDLMEERFDRIVFHLEAILPPMAHALIGKIKSEGMQVGIAINPETEVAKLSEFMPTIDTVLLLSVHPGFTGQAFIADTLGKVEELFKMRVEKHFEYLIEVDGGISPENAPKLAEAGADAIVIGSHLLQGDVTKNLEEIWEAIKG